ncbi:MAG: DNA-3-methyladenine glycosylase [Candidatus Saccharibacteria bacterium]|nr:DNA-3-methyladenine glycosylase [Candidatus Saccharibacteria bacterium]
MVKVNRLRFLEDAAPNAAKRLLGCYIEREIAGQKLVARIVETEAYDMADAASHSFKGETKRTKVMFGPAGYLYVYFTYGMHYCCNVVVGPEGYGAAVLIRAVEPIEGSEYMESRRGKTGVLATNGPAKLCQAMDIRLSDNGTDLTKGAIRLVEQPAIDQNQIITTTRIGISSAIDTPWRFYLTDNPYVSHR